MEKKEIKISLWTFYVLAAGIVILISGVLMLWFSVARNNDEDNKLQYVSDISQDVENTEKQVDNKENDIELTEEELESYVEELLKYVGVRYEEGWHADENIFANIYRNLDNENALSKNAMPNDLILSIAANWIIQERKEKDYYSNNHNVTKSEMENAIQIIFGNNINYKHRNFQNITSPTWGMCSWPYFERGVYQNQAYLLSEWSEETPMGLQRIGLEEVKINTKEGTIKVTAKYFFTAQVEFDSQYLNSRVDYYADFDFSKEAISTNPDDASFAFKNKIAIEYDIDEEGEGDLASIKTNENLGVLEENLDKLHTCEYTFKQDEKTGEYHFESFKVLK